MHSEPLHKIVFHNLWLRIIKLQSIISSQRTSMYSHGNNEREHRVINKLNGMVDIFDLGIQIAKEESPDNLARLENKTINVIQRYAEVF